MRSCEHVARREAAHILRPTAAGPYVTTYVRYVLMAYHHYDRAAQDAPAKLSATVPSTFINKHFLQQPVPNNLPNLSSLPHEMQLSPGDFWCYVSREVMRACTPGPSVPFVNHIVTFLTLRCDPTREQSLATRYYALKCVERIFHSASSPTSILYIA